MNKNTVIDLLKQVSQYPGVKTEELEQATGLLSDGIIDSIGLMSLIAGIEKSLGRCVPHDAITVKNFDSINAIMALCDTLSPSVAPLSN
jgi:acyl carrier protein